MAELLLESDDLEAVVGEVERLLQQAKEADPANFEHLQVGSPSSVDLGCMLAVLVVQASGVGCLSCVLAVRGWYGRAICTAHLCSCSAALICAEQMHLSGT